MGEEDCASGAVDDAAFAESGPVDGAEALVSGLVRNADRGIEGDCFAADIRESEVGEGKGDFDTVGNFACFPILASFPIGDLNAGNFPNFDRSGPWLLVKCWFAGWSRLSFSARNPG